MRRLLPIAAAAALAALPFVPAHASIQSVTACVPSTIGTPCAPGGALADTTGPVLTLDPTVIGAFTISGSSNTGTTATSAFFNSQTLQLSTTNGGLIDIYFTVTGVPTQQIPLALTSTFTSNQQNATTHSAILSTYLNNDNSTFGTLDQLGTSTLTSAVLQTGGPFTVTRTPGNPVSFTELYQVQLQGGCATENGGACTGNLTIDLSAAQVPEPSTLAVLGFGMVGLLGLARFSRHR